MKKPADLASSILDGPDTLKRRATTLRRLAGGLKTEIASAERTGLSDTELRTLEGALGVLEGLATAYSKACTLAQRRREEQAKAEKAIRAAMNANFDKLATIPERVALVAAVNSYVLKPGTTDSPKDLDYWFREAVDSLAYRLAGQIKGQHATVVVAEAWAKFEKARAELEAKHCHLIGRLVIEAGKPARDATSPRREN